jgi:hypothetical protein
MSGVALVQISAVDVSKLIQIGRQALDRNLAAAPDSAGLEPPMHHMLCVAALKDEHLKPYSESARPYVNMFHAGIVIACEEYECAEILELAGMPSIMVESVERGLNLLYIAGTLAQWREAVLRGCQKEVSRQAREVYNKIYAEFKTRGLHGFFNVKSNQHPRDNTFLLEYKPQ